MVELDKKYNPQNSGTELDVELVNSLPLPVYDAYRLLDSQSDYEKSLQVLCLSLIPWTYQYIALILSGEYLESSHEPSFEVTDSLLNMVKKPGPGKWISFARVASGYFMDHETKVISHEAISVLNAVLSGKNKPQAKVPDNDNKLEYTDALVSIRNRFAHSRSFTGDKAKELFQDYFQIWKALIVIIKEAFILRLLYRPSTGDIFYSFDNRVLDIDRLPTDTDNKYALLWNEKSKASIRMYPIIVTYSDESKTGSDVAFLEEIRNKYLFYLRGDNFFRLKDEFEILSKLIDSKTVKEEVISANSLTLNTFAERIDRITNQTINNFRDALKYIPEIYLDRPSIVNKLNSWTESNLPGCIIWGNPGTGKTSFIANWCVQRKLKGDHVLLFEAARLIDSDITGIIEKELNLGSPLKDCLDAIQKQNVSLFVDQKPKKFIIVIDAVNEFTGSGNENRSRLWREINSLVSILNLYYPYLKCLVTTRSDLWASDFPEKNSAFDMLKVKFYWGETTEGFPRILLEDLSMNETREIFEKARKSFPAMAVQNSFDQLSEKTKRVLCNPFLLRLALITYNGRKVPGLTKSKLGKQYARERITEEKDKKTVLFALLERMSEMRKTEVTIDEFLYSESKTKSKRKRAEKETKNLELLIYDPRPQSSYKKLIRDGIIEETSDESGIESKEKIKFSQEKTADIIESEFRRRDIKRKLKTVAIIVFFYLIVIGYGSYWLLRQTDISKNKISTEIRNNIPEQAKLEQVNSLLSELVQRFDYLLIIRYSLYFFSFILFLAGFIFAGSYGNYLAENALKSDLPAKYIKGKLNDIKQKKIWYGVLPITLLMIPVFLWMNKQMSSNIDQPSEFIKPSFYFYPILFLYIRLWALILGSIVVYKYAKSPNDAFCIFGKKEVIHSSIKFLLYLPLIVILYFSLIQMSDLMDIKTDKKLYAIRQQWISNEAIISLNQQKPEVSAMVDLYLNFPGENDLKILKSASESFSKIVVFSICIIFLITIIIEYFFGILLYKILKKRF